MTDDAVQAILERMERVVVEPRPEFSDQLFEQLISELRQEAPARQRMRRGGRPWFPARQTMLAAAALIAFVAVLAAFLPAVLRRPIRPVTLVTEDAEWNFAHVDAFQAKVFFDRNPEGSDALGIAKGATATLQVSYEGGQLREDFLGESPPGSSQGILGGPGSFLVSNGFVVGQYTVADNSFRPLSIDGLGGAIRAASLDPAGWDKACASGPALILPDEEVAGRPARHVRCAAGTDRELDLWFDAERGVVLKVSPVREQDDFQLGTSPQGSLIVTEIDYRPRFASGSFDAVAPSGSHDVGAEQKTGQARFAAFVATYAFRLTADTLRQEQPGYSGPDWVRVYRVWWKDPDAWRRETLDDTLPERDSADSGAGSFELWNGKQMAQYFAPSNSYDIGSAVRQEYNPLLHLSDVFDSSLEFLDSCPIVGTEMVIGRPAVHRRCGITGGDDVWLDAKTGLIVKRAASWGSIEVNSLDDAPNFASGTFAFVPPPGARTVEEVADDPYAQTSLKVGEVAPTWSGESLEGGTVALKSLRGHPALILLFSHECPEGDPSCDVLPAFQQAFQQWSSRLAFVWVDSFYVDPTFPGASLEDQRTKAEKIVHRAGYTFPVVLDPDWPIADRWGMKAASAWVLLDPGGKVIEVRIKPQTLEQLNDLISKTSP
jgi:AhpC/TSA family